MGRGGGIFRRFVPAIAANPFLSFSALAVSSGTLSMTWVDDDGHTQTELVAHHGRMTRWVLLLLCLMGEAQAAPHSGYADASAPVRAMQDDDTANPGFLWVQQGEGLWSGRRASRAGRSCASCHGAATGMRGVSARYPAFDARRRATR